MELDTAAPERLLPALAKFLRTHVWRIVVLSALVVTPCFWHKGIQAGDMGSHLYNAWLAQLVERGQAPGLYLVAKWNNVLFDLTIGWAAKFMGLPTAEKLVVPIFVLIFFWGCFALISRVSRKPAWYLAPAVAMLAYGYSFEAGFMNFYVSLGLAFCAAAVFWRGNRRERLWAMAFVPLIVLAHPASVLWFAAVATYIVLSEWIPGWKRLLLLPLATLAMVAFRMYLAQRAKVAYISNPYWYNGADQLWLYGDRYATLALIAFFRGAACFLYDALRKRKAGVSWTDYRIPLELYALSMVAVMILPNGIRTPHSFGFIILRFTSAIAALGLCVFNRVNLNKWHLAGLSATAAVFFFFLYQDTGKFNRMEEQVATLLKEVPAGARITYTIANPKESRIGFFVHLVDRACIGKYFQYENYESASEEFRVRVRQRNRVVVEHPNPRCEMERGHYQVQADDLPMFQLYQPKGEPGVLRIHELKAGEENGEIGIRPPASKFCTDFWGPYTPPWELTAQR